MTRSRALTSALAAAGLSLLGLAGTASAQVDYTVNGTNSQINFSCLGLIVAFTGNNCAFDGTNFTVFAAAAGSGPVALASFHAPGESPWSINGIGDVGFTSGDGNQTALDLIGTLTLDDQGTPCDADDTIAFDIAYAAGSRNFGGGPGTQGEEAWQDGDLGFTLAATTVSSAAANGAGGCDWVIGDAGAPPLITQGGANVYGDDVNIGTDPGQVPWDPNTGGIYDGATPSISQVETGVPNVGAQAGQMTVTNGATYTCTFFSGGAAPCEDGGSHHEIATNGNRAAIENTIVVVSSDAGGNITLGQVYTVDEQAVGTLGAPQWNSPLWQFTANAPGGLPTANPDSAAALEDGPTVSIDVLANDANVTNPNTLTIVGGGGSVNGGVVAVVGASPGDPAGQTIDYTPPGGFNGQDTFDYQIDDGAGNTSQATVTIDVQADIPPVAPDGASADIDTTGVAPESQTSGLDVSTLVGYDEGNPPSTVTIDTDGTLGTAVVAGTTITYTPAATSFVGSDSYVYQIEDAQGDTATGTVTVDYVDSQPTANDGAAQTDVDTDVDIDLLALIAPGNGEVSDHTLSITVDPVDGMAVLAGAVVTYTPDAAFEGDDTFTYQLEDANGDTDDGVVTITVNAAGNLVVKLPGGSSALSPLSLLLLLGLPLLRRRRQG